MNTNFGKFLAQLELEYVELFKHPDYSLAARLHTPATLANKMAEGLEDGTANKDGDGIKRTCRALGIPYTYKAIKAYLREPPDDQEDDTWAGDDMMGASG